MTRQARISKPWSVPYFGWTLLALLAAYAFVLPIQAAEIDEGVAAVDKKDFAKASRYFREAVARGDVEGDYHLGVMAYMGEGRAPDAKSAAEHWQRAADAGMVLAQYNLARLYRAGDGVAKDAARARSLYRPGADLGAARTMIEFGEMLARGEGGAPDVEGADLWMQRALSERRELAVPVLAKLRSENLLVNHASPRWQERRDSRAIAGDRDALFLLASDYLNGDGVPADRSKAIKLFAAAGEKGDAMAQMALSALLVDVDHATADFPRARSLGFSAAKLKHPDALWSMGINIGCCTSRAADREAAIVMLSLAFWYGTYEAGALRQTMIRELPMSRRQVVLDRGIKCRTLGIAECGLFDGIIFPGSDR